MKKRIIMKIYSVDWAMKCPKKFIIWPIFSQRPLASVGVNDFSKQLLQ